LEALDVFDAKTAIITTLNEHHTHLITENILSYENNPFDSGALENSYQIISDLGASAQKIGANSMSIVANMMGKMVNHLLKAI
jgi:hypothetical protein